MVVVNNENDKLQGIPDTVNNDDLAGISHHNTVYLMAILLLVRWWINLQRIESLGLVHEQ